MRPPVLRDDLPRYPPLLQLLRVTEGTVPGPTAGASAGVGTGNIPPSVLYVSSTQQSRTDTISPRDREPCLCFDPNGTALTPGYYLGRLCNSHHSLPVYEVIACCTSGGSTGQVGPQGPSGVPGPQGPAGSSGLLPGLTTVQLERLTASLTPVEIANLYNLNSCQLQVLVQLPMANIQLLTDTLDQTGVGNVVDNLTFTQLKKIVTEVPPAQVVVVSSAYPALYQLINQTLTPQQAVSLLGALTSQQISVLGYLTPAQLQAVAQLTPAQLQKLTGLTAPQLPTIVGQFTPVQLGTLLDGLTTQQLQQLGNKLTPDQLQTFGQLLTTDQVGKLAPLTTGQIANLANLSPTQLQTVVQLPTGTLQTLTGSLTAAQLQNLVDTLSPTGFDSLVSAATTPQLIVASSANPQLYQMVGQVLTTAQVNTLLTNLSSQQFGTLVGLNATQLQTVASLTTAQMQALTNLTAAQVTALVGQLTASQLGSVLTTFTTAQLQQLTNNLASPQVSRLLQALSVSQLQSAVANLTSAQLTSLTQYEPVTVGILFNSLSISNLRTLLNLSPLQPGPVLGCQSLFPQIPAITAQPSSVPGPLLQGYTPVVVDATGKLWAYTGGSWANLSSGGSGALPDPVTVPHGGTGLTALTDKNLLIGSGSGNVGFIPPGASGVPLSGISPSNTPAFVPITELGMMLSDSTLWDVSLQRHGFAPKLPNDSTKFLSGMGVFSGTRTEGTLAAAGNTQGTAAAIVTDAVVVTGADGTKGVILPNSPGAIVLVNNPGISGLKVYPNSGASISGGATNAAVSITTVTVVYFRVSSTAWRAVTLS